MKSINVVVALLLLCSFGLGGMVDKVFAKATASEVTAAVEQANGNNGGKSQLATIDINTADEQLLVQVKGIGPATARKIVSYRQENGNFKSVDELVKVKGIGEKSLAKMKPYLQKI